jgi:RNA polymerase primary sigma factor
MEHFNLSKAQLNRARSCHYSYLSLDQKVSEDDDDSSPMGNLITDVDQKNPLDVLTEVNRNETLHGLLDELKPREKLILQLRFGLNGQDYHTLESIGDQFDLTRERIRQIEKVALKKLRALIIEKNQIKTC